MTPGQVKMKTSPWLEMISSMTSNSRSDVLAPFHFGSRETFLLDSSSSVSSLLIIHWLVVISIWKPYSIEECPNYLVQSVCVCKNWGKQKVTWKIRKKQNKTKKHKKKTKEKKKETEWNKTIQNKTEEEQNKKGK